MATAEIKRVWNSIIELGPHPNLPTHGTNPTIHHCHSGSVARAGIHRGMGRKPSDWLAVCLPHSLHVGGFGIDYGYGVQRWERDFMPQMELLCWTSDQIGINLFKKAGYDIDIHGVEYGN
jgi:hypothetical protein